MKCSDRESEINIIKDFIGKSRILLRTLLEINIVKDFIGKSRQVARIMDNVVYGQVRWMTAMLERIGGRRWEHYVYSSFIHTLQQLEAFKLSFKFQWINCGTPIQWNIIQIFFK